MSRNISISSLGIFNYELSIIDDIQASNEKSWHEDDETSLSDHTVAKHRLKGFVPEWATKGGADNSS